MFRLGEFQTLKVEKKVDFGVYLVEENPEEGTSREADDVLLPKKQVPETIVVGDIISVFLYRDSDDRMIATCEKPFLTLHHFAPLVVKEKTKIGAFLDWGLEKDLFLPYKEMNGDPREGDTILVHLYLDKSNRLCASMRGIYHLLSTNAPYDCDDEVSGRIYEFGYDFGVFVAVDDKYSAMLPKYEKDSNFRIGDIITARVVQKKEDGKLDLSMRDKSYLQMDEDAQSMLELIDSYCGVLPFTEKASPEVIQRETGLSKNAFKRAIGRLYKEKQITICDGKIKKI